MRDGKLAAPVAAIDGRSTVESLIRRLLWMNFPDAILSSY
jgi:hypothetical protein